MLLFFFRIHFPYQNLDVFLPCPDNLLVNLKECRELINDLLQQLPKRFANEHDNMSALGAALQAAFKLMVDKEYLAEYFLKTFFNLVCISFSCTESNWRKSFSFSDVLA